MFKEHVSIAVVASRALTQHFFATTLHVFR
ncbi:Uncharacterised protein [Vibrio cholerae]|nr:Uncharacterised protein [Vibrio cholerae]